MYLVIFACRFLFEELVLFLSTQMYLLSSDTEYDTHKDSERQFMFEWRRLEERLRKDEEQRLAELEAEREQCLNSAREEEEKRRRSEQLKEELRRTEAMNQVCLSVKDLRKIPEYFC